MISNDKLIFVGTVTSAHGIKGDVIVKSFTTDPTNICRLHLVDDTRKKVALKLIRQNSKGELICRLNQINNRTDAEKLKGYKIFCTRETMPEVNEDEFYIEDLRNLQVVDHNLKPIGVVTNIFNFGAGDIIEIDFNGAIEMLPFTKELFPEITKNYVVMVLKFHE